MDNTAREPSAIIARAASRLDGFHVASGKVIEVDGRHFWLKRRPLKARLIMHGANVFFRLTRNPVRAVACRNDWTTWETQTFQMLHGPDFTGVVNNDGAVQFDILPGEDTSALLATGKLTPEIIASIGIELKRAHGFESGYYGAAWSHGDCHTGNFLFDPSENRARLIDFEIRHLRSLPEDVRHADDLLIVLQDVCGRCAERDWLPLAHAFLGGYAPSAPIKQTLKTRLHIPHGFPRLWWAVRTTWMKREELESRIGALRECSDLGLRIAD